ncbi:MAG: thiosulfate oxidation carrier complex protein SoxZ [Anaeromyxobacteraceae bacterium]
MGRTSGDEIHAPELRITELVRDGNVRRGALVHAQVKMRHPNRTGLALRDGKFVRESQPFYLQELEVAYAGDRVSRFALTPALSDDPFIGFTLVAGREGRLEVRLVNNRGQRFAAEQDLRFG